MKVLRICVTYAAVFTMTASCGNILEDTANKNSEEAILYAAKRYLAQGDWSNAIAQFSRLTAATLAQTEVLVQRASAYSGRCGLDFLTIADNLNNYSVTSKFFPIVLPFVVTTTSNYADCLTAENLLKTIATAGVVSDPVGKFLMAFNSLAKISSILNFYADTDDDGVVDAGWDPCGGGGLANLPDADLNEIVTGFFLFINNIAGLAVGGSMPDFLTACEGVLGAGNCDIVDTASVTNAERWFLRAAIAETDDNIGFAVRAGDTAAVLATFQCNI